MLPSYWIVQLFISAVMSEMSQFEPRPIDELDVGDKSAGKPSMFDDGVDTMGEGSDEIVEDFDDGSPTDGYSKLACTQENKTYTVDLRLHADDGIINTIHKVGNPDLSMEKNLASYFGTIFDDLNSLLWPFHVQLHLDLNSFSSSSIMGNKSSDTTCEGNAPIEEKTFSALEHLQSTLKNKVGIQVFIWECNYLGPQVRLTADYENFTCGHLIGVAWMGEAATRFLIMKAILKALTNAQIPEGVDLKNIDPLLLAGICKLTDKCIGMMSSVTGQIVTGRNMIRYTLRPNHSHVKRLGKRSKHKHGSKKYVDVH